MKRFLILLFLTACFSDNKVQNRMIPDELRPKYKQGDRLFFETEGDTFSVKVSFITGGLVEDGKQRNIFNEWMSVGFEKDTLGVPFIRGWSGNYGMSYFFSGGRGASPGKYFGIQIPTSGNFSDTISGRQLNDLVRFRYSTPANNWLIDPIYSWGQGMVKFTDTTGRVWRRKF